MSPKILVADDDLDNRTILEQAFAAAGIQVLQAVNGEEALALALRELPDAILLDLSMPRVDGWEAARRIRREPRLATVPLFAFTAHAMPGDELKAREAGCDGYIAKPCIPREVVREVLARLKAKAHGGAP